MRGASQKNRRLTRREDNLIRTSYPDYVWLQKKLRHRSYSALRSRAGALRLRPKQHRWTQSERALLVKLFGHVSRQELRAAFPGLSYSALARQRAATVSPQPRTLSSTGDPYLDAIRVRCRALKVSMKDLDRWARTGSYFYKAAWLSVGKANRAKLCKAIEALGGTLTVVWPSSF